ncbi:COP9 signalosome complex subunit 7b isoform X1 [Nasonia vitripennis]|uniref:PCI domain-containing protein n=1 Tax=Nasonia vitripennis TaxID=7425 RepID=A0A7M7LV30_NASVI|nr:COP9 signalosome complex subunit 7b isoform X1 [Nasonia vitripennis]XP_008214280.1 COP9 signalosome complex subunit 7b isoform X1 [Nasonia vitripennis]XP_031782659.1 COP9 signalosome complex subunit 7b isoform X1 [Nasonia vitripennis]
MTSSEAATAEAPASTEKAATNPLEQFVLLAKTAKGAAALELIKQAVETPGVHVFGELLDMPNIKELENSPHAEYWNTLNLFAYGTYKEYLANKSQLLDLTPVQKKKLQHLTIVTLATKSRCIPYSILLEELDIKNVRDLEDLIIEAIYADIIHGKLDQKNSQLEVDYTGLGRDVRPGDAGAVAETLAEWGQACSDILNCIEQQVNKANSEKTRAIQHKDKIQKDIAFVKKTIASQPGSSLQDADMAPGGSGSGTSDASREALCNPLSLFDMKKKMHKGKSMRGERLLRKTARFPLNE